MNETDDKAPAATVEGPKPRTRPDAATSRQVELHRQMGEIADDLGYEGYSRGEVCVALLTVGAERLTAVGGHLALERWSKALAATADRVRRTDDETKRAGRSSLAGE